MNFVRNMPRTLCNALVLGTVLFPELTSAQTVWTKHPANPVLRPGPAGSWDSPDVHGHAVVFDETDTTASPHGTYKMWFNVSSPGKQFFHVSYATSKDGARWERHDEPVLSRGEPGAWDGGGIFLNASVLIDDRPGNENARFKMWYGGWNFLIEEGNEKIGYAVSSDGIKWRKFEGYVFDPEPGNIESPIMEPSVIFVETAEEPFHMFYVAGESNSVARIDLATSKNGRNWTKRHTVLSGRPEPFYDTAVYTPGVIYDGNTRTFHLWYSGGDIDDLRVLRIFYATSLDLLTWHGRDMVLREGPEGAWDSAGLGPHHPAVRFDPRRNIYEMWYYGATGGGRFTNDENQSIGYATSPLDGTAPRFRRGDTNGDGSMNVSDAVALLHHLFGGGDAPGCRDAADADDDGALGITDAIYGLAHLFRGEPAPPMPGSTVCGEDPTKEQPELGCVVPPRC